ncbi:phosphatidylinositol-3-phosphatase myotubularin-1-like [Syzygium oleosum]|uniref:phosphatidylinositol-3-phosphatase myotubularin-1-like n=1 Tax=Syzygium oleosum TaxID=219896 RepID=UPI0024BB6607|nr:phosphatidylinositol-3-phosphatase myotubularin-1-like [Syzygium oleosum]
MKRLFKEQQNETAYHMMRHPCNAIKPMVINVVNNVILGLGTSNQFIPIQSNTLTSGLIKHPKRDNNKIKKKISLNGRCSLSLSLSLSLAPESTKATAFAGGAEVDPFRRIPRSSRAAPPVGGGGGGGAAAAAAPEPEKMEGAGSWDVLEWTKIEPISRSVSLVQCDFLLEAEKVVVEGYGVVLVNTDEAGTILVTNYRILFLSEETRNIIPLGTIPLATIEKIAKIAVKGQLAPRQPEKSPSQRLLQVIGKDMRIIVFGFRPRTKQRRAIFDALLGCTKPAGQWEPYAIISGPSKFRNTNPKLRLLNEYFRLIGRRSHRASMSIVEDCSFTVANELWRISSVNANYTLCQTYPFALIVPKCISDEEILQASNFRARGRLPVVTWCHPGTGAVLARSSQPLVGLMMNMRSNTDEKLVAALCSNLSGLKGMRRKLYIADARPRKNALANGAMGGGSESSSNYFQSEIVFFGIDNIHAMRESLARLREYLDTHGATSSDGISSFLRHGGWTWGGGNLSSMSASVSTLGDSGWLIHIQSVLAGSAWIAARVALESASVLVHCSDGWDRTTQLVSLASLLLDPYYRTFAGFQALVEKDWLAFGHPFSDRFGLPAISGGGNTELSRQSSTGSYSSSPMRQSSGSFTTQAPSSSHSQASNNCSPIFLQWVDCISQLLRMYPFAFEFSSTFLVDFLDCVLSCRFGNFLCNSEKERQQCSVSEACGCLWAYLTDLRISEGKSHVHYNLFYDPSKHNGPLLPPAAALAPTLWPQFHLRWACPSEAQAEELEAQCRNMAMKFSELQKAKEVTERKAKEVAAAAESLTADLQRERQLNTYAVNLAKKASKENAAIKRAIQSLGCKVHFSGNGDCTVDIEANPTVSPQVSMYSYSKRESDDPIQRDEKSDLSVSITVVGDEDLPNNPINRVCESLCPMRTRDGGCRWPDAGCAQLGSQFVGLRANFDAFDRLSIYDSYFDSDKL